MHPVSSVCRQTDYSSPNATPRPPDENQTPNHRRWSPASRDLRRLRIKNSDLRGADLSGADLRAANLRLSDLRGADLTGADLRWADLEGVDFAGADLTGADLSGAALSAARFFGPAADGGVLEAKVEGLRFAGASGLLEGQQDFLSKRLVENP